MLTLALSLSALAQSGVLALSLGVLSLGVVAPALSFGVLTLAL